LLDQIPENSNIAYILNPKLLAGELLAAICDELHIEYPKEDPSIKILIDRIYEYLLEQNAQGRKTVVIIEEAQNLTNDVLEQLRLLTNLETNQRKLMQIIMLGQPELLEILAQPELRQLEQRVTARYHLMPLTQRETAEYVEHRLGVAGARERDPIFTAAALKKVYKYSEGVPRKINLLCDRALLGAYVHNVKTVDGKTVNQAYKEVEGRRNRPNKRRQRIGKDMWLWGAANLVLMIGVIILGYAVYTKPEVVAALFKGEVNAENGSSLSDLQSIDFIDTQPAEVSKRYAYLAVLEKWGTSPQQATVGEDFCERASAYELSCLKRDGNLRSLRHYNRPAVLTLINDKGKTIYAAITAMDDSSARLSVNNNVITVAHKELESRWFGDYTLVWRPPPEYSGNMAPGASGQDVVWLANALAAVNGQSLPDTATVQYDDKLVDKVKSFQLKMGLISDGIAGAQTLIHLNTEANLGVPTLARDELTQPATAAKENMSHLVSKPVKGS
jgi:general secretion pathway protein A